MPRWRILIFAFIAALIAIFPLRVAMALSSGPLSAQFVGGFVWGGRAIGAQIGGIPLGDLRIALAPLDLLAGRVRLIINGAVQGAIVSSFGQRGVDVEAMSLPISRTIGPLTVSQVELAGARVRFRGEDCAEAEGQLAVMLSAALPSGAASGRFSGPLKCDGKAMSALLVSQSAMDRLAIRFLPGGRYDATFVTRPADEAAAASLRQAGFRETSSGFSVRTSGTF
jgi:hypothetical protein